MEPIDWDRVADCLWQRFFRVSFVYEHVDDPAPLLRTLACLNTSFRAETSRTWRELARPYLAYVYPPHAYRMFVCEMHQRRMVAALVDRLSLVSGTRRVCVAGGYAAWQLERWVETETGRDAFPRTVRGTHVWNRHQLKRLWVPADIDLFVHSEDPDLAMDLVLDTYHAFVARVFPNAPRVHVSSSSDYDPLQDAGADVPPTEAYVETMARVVGLHEHCVSRCAERCTPYAPSIVRASHHVVVEETETLVPLRLNVVFTHDPPPPATDSEEAFARWVLRSFDLNHCRVAARVVPDGTLAFACTRSTFMDLAYRRLRLTDRALCNLRTCRNTLRRVEKYLSCGFTFEGDDAHDHEWLETLAARVRLLPPPSDEPP